MGAAIEKTAAFIADWRAGSKSAWAHFCEIILAEQDRWFLWLPVLMGTGAAIHLSWPIDPGFWPAVIIIFSGLALILLGAPRHFIFGLLGWTLAATALGFALMHIRVEGLRAPIIERAWGPEFVEGRILRIEPQDRGLRLTLDRLVLGNLPPSSTPQRIRISARIVPENLRAGMRVRVRARLTPPSGPSAPGAFDFARWSYFRAIGGVGQGIGPLEILSLDSDGGAWLETAGFEIHNFQQNLTRRIQLSIPGEAGAIAAALMTGERGAISDNTEQSFRDSGLTHILSISGLHLSIVAGILFFGLRRGLALWPRIALRYPIKKWAAFAAIIGSAAYMLLSGAAIPTQRAFLMTAIFLAGVILDREALSMRSVAWAGLVILIFLPESVVDPGFQMSFAAVAALIALYEILRDRLVVWRAEMDWPRRILLYLFLMMATSFVAGITTAPYAAWHFNRMVNYGLVANALALPLTSILTMPLAVIAFLAMPFNLEAWPLWMMGISVEILIAISYWVSALPGAALSIPASSLGYLSILSLGMAWVLIWNGAWRWLGIVGLSIGALGPWLSNQPNLLIDSRARFIGLFAEGNAMLSARQGGGMVGQAWLRRMGIDTSQKWPREGESFNFGPAVVSCEKSGCLIDWDQQKIAFVRSEDMARRECGRADLIIADFPVWRSCRPGGRSVLIDRIDLWRYGSHALWINKMGIELVTAREMRGERPWVLPKPKVREKQNPRRHDNGEGLTGPDSALAEDSGINDNGAAAPRGAPEP